MRILLGMLWDVFAKGFCRDYDRDRAREWFGVRQGFEIRSSWKEERKKLKTAFVNKINVAALTQIAYFNRDGSFNHVDFKLDACVNPRYPF